MRVELGAERPSERRDRRRGGGGVKGPSRGQRCVQVKPWSGVAGAWGARGREGGGETSAQAGTRLGSLHTFGGECWAFYILNFNFR